MSMSQLHTLIEHFLHYYYTDRPCAAKTYYTKDFRLIITHKLDYRPGMIEDMKWKFDFKLNSNLVQIASFETFLAQQNNRTMLQNKLQSALIKQHITACKNIKN